MNWMVFYFAVLYWNIAANHPKQTGGFVTPTECWIQIVSAGSSEGPSFLVSCLGAVHSSDSNLCKKEDSCWHISEHSDSLQ